MFKTCNGDFGGEASVDDCDVCTGGNTDIQPNSTCDPDAHVGLFRVDSIPADGTDPRCPHGGLVVHVGLDDGDGAGEADDGILSDDEINQSHVVCNGAPGPAGEAGADGQQGERGEPGAEGTQGAQGERGPQGEAGADGQQGERGEPGADGQQGAQGAQGVPGPQGPQGADGMPGPQGEQGPQGEPGADGVSGVDGQAGAAGPAGVDGVDGAAGPEGPAGIPLQALVSTDGVPAGDRCKHGGTQIRTGIDDGNGDGVAGDGILQMAEVDSETFVCNGAPGPSGCAQVGHHNTRIPLWVAMTLLAGCLRRRRRTRA